MEKLYFLSICAILTLSNCGPAPRGRPRAGAEVPDCTQVDPTKCDVTYQKAGTPFAGCVKSSDGKSCVLASSCAEITTAKGCTNSTYDRFGLGDVSSCIYDAPKKTCNEATIACKAVDIKQVCALYFNGSKWQKADTQDKCLGFKGQTGTQDYLRSAICKWTTSTSGTGKCEVTAADVLENDASGQIVFGTSKSKTATKNLSEFCAGLDEKKCLAVPTNAITQGTDASVGINANGIILSATGYFCAPAS